MIIKRYYKDQTDYGVLLTPCPNNNLKAVGSFWCSTYCGYSVNNNFKEKYVECNKVTTKEFINKINNS